MDTLDKNCQEKNHFCVASTAHRIHFSQKNMKIWLAAIALEAKHSRNSKTPVHFSTKFCLFLLYTFMKRFADLLFGKKLAEPNYWWKKRGLTFCCGCHDERRSWGETRGLHPDTTEATKVHVMLRKHKNGFSVSVKTKRRKPTLTSTSTLT